MDKKIMQQLIKEALSKKLGAGFTISIQEVFKTNQKRDALTILPKQETITPAIYLEPYYKDLEGHMPLEDVINDILEDYARAKCHSENLNCMSVSDFNWSKDRLYVRLINRHLNEELLKDVPHSLFLDDFAVTVHCRIGTGEQGTASTLVTNSLAEIWGIRSDSLISLALQNTRKLLEVDLVNMEDFLKQADPYLFFGTSLSSPIWILTNSQRLFGAACILFDDVLKDFAENFGNFYVIFSSVHEVLLFPAQDNSNISRMTSINQSVNADELAQDEILGTKAYYYSKDNGFVL